MHKVGAATIDILEWAGTRYLRQSEPDLYQAYLLHVGAAEVLRCYDGTEMYWERVQAILDTFFRSSERAEICGRLIVHCELSQRPEFHGFLMRALAERRLQSLLEMASIGSVIRPNPGPTAARRPS